MTSLTETARKYIGTRRGDPESDKLITKWNAAFNFPLEVAFCATFVSAMIKETEFTTSFIGSASALGLWNKNQIFKTERPYTGCIFIWDFGNGTGHAGLVDEIIENNKMNTIEGNTTNPAILSNKSERDGGWVISRVRKALPGVYGNITLLGFLDPFRDG